MLSSVYILGQIYGVAPNFHYFFLVQVVSDSGKLELSEVFKLINEGESLPVHFEKDMKVYVY